MSDFIPWWVFALVGGLVVFAVWRVLGSRPALAAAVVAVVATFYRLGRKRGSDKTTEKVIKRDQERAETIQEKAAEARADSDRRSADVVELRKPDGWRRD